MATISHEPSLPFAFLGTTTVARYGFRGRASRLNERREDFK